MKTEEIIYIIVITAIMTILIMVVSYDCKAEQLPKDLISTCTAKIEVTAFTYGHLDKIDQDLTLKVLKRDWNTDWSNDPNIKHASYVDMQRIVRDAYRMKEAGQVTPDTAAEQMDREILACFKNGF